MWKDIPLLGFVPDLPPTTEGAVTRTQYLVPTDLGFGPMPMLTEGASTALNSQSLGGAVVSQTNATMRVFVGTASKMYEFSTTGGSITDRSDTAYAATTTDTWSITQFGDVTLFANKQNILRQINAGGALAAVGIAPTPKAAIIVTVGPVSGPVVMAFDYDDGTNNYRDGWFASGLTNPLNVTGWTTGVNECSNGRLLDDIPGPVTAAIAYRDDVIAWKRTGMYLGTYTGDASKPWAWRRISSDIGCIGKNCVTRANDIIYWGDDSGIWSYDGSYPRMVPGQIHNYWSKAVLTYATTDANRNFFRAVWDKPRHLLWMFAGSSGPAVEIGMSWNSVSGLWAQHDLVAGLNALNNFTNAAETVHVVELFNARYGVTQNNKLALLAWGANGTEPHSAWIFGWSITNFVNPPILNGLRPHWLSSTGTGTWGFGNFYTVLAARDISPLGVNTNGSTTTLTFVEPGHLYGKQSGPVMTWRFGVSDGFNWEIAPIVGVDIQSLGKT